MFQRFTPFSGPKSFSFTDPDSKHHYEAPTMKGLLTLIRGYRSQNSLPEIEFLEDVVTNYLCNKPENAGACEPMPPFKRGVMQYLKGGVALLTNLVYLSTVPQAVADERSEICLKCPLNVFPDKGNFLKWSDEMAELSVGTLKSKNHDKLGNCGGCSCTLKPKVFFNGKITLTPNELKIMEDSNPQCWQVKEVKKYG